MTTEISLTTDQSLAMEKMLAFATMSSNRIFTLAGFAGVGKTTVMAAFASEISKRMPVALTAPTNKAVKVLRDMAEKRGGMDKVAMQTIYSFLGLRLGINGEFKEINYCKPEKTSNFTRGRECGIVIIDESSMVGLNLFEYIVNIYLKTHPYIKVIFVGDPMQLPPVNESVALPFTNYDEFFRLDKIVRQAEDNPIIRLTVRLRGAISKKSIDILDIFEDSIGHGDGVFTLNDDVFLAWIKHSFTSEEYKTDPNSFRVIAWRNKTVDKYNNFIRECIYGKDMAKQRFIMNERVAAVSPVFEYADGETEPVMTMRTDDEAITLRMEPKTIKHSESYYDKKEEKQVLIKEHIIPCNSLFLKTEAGNNISANVTDLTIGAGLVDSIRNDLKQKAISRGYGWKEYYSFLEKFSDVRVCGHKIEFCNIRPAHTLTAHKSQGSTFGRVYVDAIDILANNNRTEALRCLYVAVSRSRLTTVIRTTA